MGSCVSVHKSPQDSAMKLGLSFESKTDSLIIPPSPVKEKKPAANGHFALKSQSPYSFKPKDFGSKEETFFDSRAYLDSDCEDDFFSVNGDFTPSRGNTPVHHSFSTGTPRVNKATVDGSPLSISETSPTGNKKLLDLFRESVRENGDVKELNNSSNQDISNGTPYVSGANSLCSSERTANGDNPMFKEKPFKSMQCCLPSFVSCSNFNERKKKMSPAIAVNDRCGKMLSGMRIVIKMRTQILTYMNSNSIKMVRTNSEIPGRDRIILNTGLFHSSCPFAGKDLDDELSDSSDIVLKYARLLIQKGKLEDDRLKYVRLLIEKGKLDERRICAAWDQSDFALHCKIPGPECLGPLEVDKLPMDAWQSWCKDGVLCFGEEVQAMMKVYFADPRNLSVYHVIDFDYMKFGRSYDSGSPSCILSGSKIYILGGHSRGRHFVDVYFCDVSTPPDGNYEWHWQRGPSLNSCKVNPLLFSLKGNIYVFSMAVDQSDHFEVLKSDSSHWQVLPPPPPPSLSLLEDRIPSPEFPKGFFKISDDTIIVSCGNSVAMYDVECNEWTTKELSGQVPKIDSGVNFTMDCLHAGENGLFDPSEQGIYHMRSFCSQFFQACPIEHWPENHVFRDIRGFEIPRSEFFFWPPQWHLFQIRDRKFCFIALYEAMFEIRKSCAQVGTFDLEESDKQDSKLLKLGNSCYQITDLKSRVTVLTSDNKNTTFPDKFCSKT
ncbi:hypothetical protein V6N11_014803 [Hibiscus sabdariffa]|uniref:Uncharacterized protein n=1 Tax=Hibiscus sabdariffa TaxID=183260 RepID=A0ABR2TQW3_9ROSI